jgi:hypothetical protein
MEKHHLVSPASVPLTSGPAGHYYVAMTYDIPPDLAPSPTTNGRFHVRGEDDTAGYNIQISVLVSNSTSGPVCGTADYNGDGDSGTDADIEAFFACLGGSCCPTCWHLGADFNGDGDSGTDADIESFFRVLAGNPC